MLVIPVVKEDEGVAESGEKEEEDEEDSEEIVSEDVSGSGGVK